MAIENRYLKVTFSFLLVSYILTGLACDASSSNDISFENNQSPFTSSGESLPSFSLGTIQNDVEEPEAKQLASQVSVKTDMDHYDKEDIVIIILENHSEKQTYVWLGPCSLKLEYNNHNSWETSPTNWSGCPWCGQAREIPGPRFMAPGDIEEIDWDQRVSCAEDKKEEDVVGRFRFLFRYAEDEAKCHAAADPLMCWLNQKNKNWRSVYSNEFTIE